MAEFMTAQALQCDVITQSSVIMQVGVLSGKETRVLYKDSQGPGSLACWLVFPREYYGDQHDGKLLPK